MRRIFQTRSFTFGLLLFFAIPYFSCRKKRWKCEEEVSYKNDIQPLLDAHCNKCHSYDSYKDVQSMAASGRMKDATIEKRRMPPAGEKRLTLEERKMIYCWLEAGGPDN